MLDDTKIAEGINAFPPCEERIEISVEEFQSLSEEIIDLYNTVLGLVKGQNLMPQREAAKFNDRARRAIKDNPGPIAKLKVTMAYIRQLIAKLKNRPASIVTKPQEAVSKIQLRAKQLIDYCQKKLQGKERAQVSTIEARTYLTGIEGKPPSRRDTLRAFRRALSLQPGLQLEQIHGDLRGTKRLILESLENEPSDYDFPVEPQKSSQWQRSRLSEVRAIFNLG